MEHFQFLSDAGKTSLPTNSEILNYYEKTGERIILVLDSSVCIDIVNLVNWKEKAKSDKLKIYNLIDYAQKNNVDFLSVFALVESCYDKETLKIKSEKLFDFSSRLQFAFGFPLKKFKKHQYNFDRDSNAIKPPENHSSEVVENIIDSRINPFYAGLLKISQIAKMNGISKIKAEKNIESFIDWMENELGFFLGHEYSLALNIFGGNSKFGSMLKINSTKEVAIKASWGTAWDMFHAKMSTNKSLISELVEEKVFPIFVTKDIGLFNLISPYVSSYKRRAFKKVSIIQNEEYPPFYTDEFMKKLNERMTKAYNNRFNIDSELDSDKVKRLIKILENSLE